MKFTVMVTLLITLFIATAHASEKHVHGEAQLFIVIDGERVLIELETPADNILGFEHRPSTQEQQQLLDKSLVLLDNHKRLLSFDQGACQQLSREIESPFSDQHADEHDGHDEHAGDHHDHDGHHGHDNHHDHADKHEEHTSFHLTYTLNCSDAMGITSATVTAFESFEGFNSIEVNWVKGDRQSSRKVTKDKTSITFK